jgi:hypothetical protein
MERIKFMAYKGHKILVIDHSGLDENEIIENIKKGSRFLMDYKSAENQILLITDFRNTYGTNKVMDALKTPEAMEGMKKVKKTAVIGITGVKKILLNAYNRFTSKNVYAFNTMEEAQEYLVSE